MKRIFAAAAALTLTILVNAQNMGMRVTPFYTKDEAPHMEYVLPEPPSLTDPLFFNDWAQYNWGKSIRDTERGRQAVEDAAISAGFFMKRFAPAMTYSTTPESNPILYQLLLKAHRTEGQAGASAKAHFKRVRPYQQYKEPSGVPAGENPNDFTSYPSGHTHASWLVGMILTAIDPSHTETIMKVAYELGQSRVIVGYHYQSDVDAGRVVGSITFARLCADEEFLSMLQQAKEEYWKNDQAKAKK
ncbi:MAG: phosphatase PAP2 family protein [Bacteroidales bacterium]|nr:phosphatase PAP2 family protein [Bacteroidales bacterium]